MPFYASALLENKLFLSNGENVTSVSLHTVLYKSFIFFGVCDTRLTPTVLLLALVAALLVPCTVLPSSAK